MFLLNNDRYNNERYVIMSSAMPRYKKNHKEQAREAILLAAGRALKRSGYGGIGIDGLMSAAGVTSGAFYTHFKSKDSLLKDVLEQSSQNARERLKTLREKDPDGWLPAYVDFYLGPAHLVEFEDGCVLAALSGDVGRLSESVQAEYRQNLQAFTSAIAEGLSEGTEERRRKKARSLVAMMLGGLVIARGIADLAQASEYLSDLRDQAKRMISERE